MPLLTELGCLFEACSVFLRVLCASAFIFFPGYCVLPNFFSSSR